MLLASDFQAPDADAQTTSGGPGMSLLLHVLVGAGVTALGSAGWYSVAPLLAEVSTGETVGLGATIAALSVIATKAFDYLVGLRKSRADDDERREARRVEEAKRIAAQATAEKTAEIAHLNAILNRETAERRQLQLDQQADRRQHALEMNEIRARQMRAEVKLGRAVTWIRSAEHLMRTKKWEHVPFDNDMDGDDDSDDAIEMHGPAGGTAV